MNRNALTEAHYAALKKVVDEAFRDIDGRLMRVIVRLGLATKLANGNWKLTAQGKTALKNKAV
jgi:hypothetical protein